MSVKTSQNVDDSEIADVADMKAGARGVGEHFGEHHLGLAWFFGSFEGLVGGPFLLPFLFDFKWIVSFHGYYYTIPCYNIGEYVKESSSVAAFFAESAVGVDFDWAFESS